MFFEENGKQENSKQLFVIVFSRQRTEIHMQDRQEASYEESGFEEQAAEVNKNPQQSKSDKQDIKTIIICCCCFEFIIIFNAPSM